jgi:hypothetical protein
MDPNEFLNFIDAVQRSMMDRQFASSDFGNQMGRAAFRQLEQTGNSIGPITDSFVRNMNPESPGYSNLLDINNFSRTMLPQSILEDMGNRSNVMTGLGDIAGTIMLKNMARDQPELMQWFGGAPRYVDPNSLG